MLCAISVFLHQILPTFNPSNNTPCVSTAAASPPSAGFKRKPHTHIFPIHGRHSKASPRCSIDFHRLMVNHSAGHPSQQSVSVLVSHSRRAVELCYQSQQSLHQVNSRGFRAFNSIDGHVEYLLEVDHAAGGQVQGTQVSKSILSSQHSPASAQKNFLVPTECSVLLICRSSRGPKIAVAVHVVGRRGIRRLVMKPLAAVWGMVRRRPRRMAALSGVQDWGMTPLFLGGDETL